MASSASTLRKRKEPASDEGPCQRPHPSEQQIPCKKPVSWSGLWYGSDCSGLDAGAFALKRLSSEFRHWFGSESHEPYRRVFSTLHPTCENVFSDAQRKPFNDLQKERKSSRNSTKAMVYTAGFPCQPFSRAGLGLAMSDERAAVIWDILLTIAMLLPEIWLLENVKDLACDQKYRETFREILDFCVKIGGGAYFVDWQVLDSYEYGVPATRCRVYIVGVLKGKLCQPWQWPKPLPKASLSSILVPRRKDEEKDIRSLSTTCLRNLAGAFQKISKKGDASWKKKPWVVDCQNSSSRGVHFTFDRFPTITKSHAAGLWIVSKNDFAKPVELLAGQGILPIDLPVEIDSLPVGTISQMAGNAFTLNVVKCLLDILLEAIGY